jgi:hypothetical protein
MSLLFIDGCGEIYGTSEIGKFFNQSDSPVNVHATLGRRGGACIRIGGINDDMRVGFPGHDTIVCGFAVKRITYSAGNTNLCHFSGPSASAVSWQVTSSGAIRVLSSSAERAISAGGVFLADTWHYLELKALIHNSAGTLEVRIDGDIVIDVTGIDTLQSGLALVDGVSWVGQGLSNQTLIDDIYILNTAGPAPYNDFLGDSRVDGLLPNGAGFSSDFPTATPSGTHFENVDENPPDGDTSYNESNVANDIDLFDVAALPVITGGATVWAVQASAFLNKQDAGPAPFRLLTRPTSTTFNGDQKEPPIDYVYKHQIWELNPQTAAEWTEAEVDAAEFGVEAL